MKITQNELAELALRLKLAARSDVGDRKFRAQCKAAAATLVKLSDDMNEFEDMRRIGLCPAICAGDLQLARDIT